MGRPDLVGPVEVEERRPRTWNEPRHKRLKFVRGRRQDSEESVVTRSHAKRATQQATWGNRRTQITDSSPISSSTSDDSSSSTGSFGFGEGVRAGRQSLSETSDPRRRSRSRSTDDSFEHWRFVPRSDLRYFDRSLYVGAPESIFFPPPSINGETTIEWSRKILAPTRDEAKFLAFLSLYGSNGVPLRELIEFATLRTSSKTSENHWQLCGEVGPILRPVGSVSLCTHCSFLNTFVRETSEDQGIDGLQKRLLSLGLIEVENTMGRSSKDDWRTDERVWRVANNRISSHLMIPMRDGLDGLDGEGIIMEILYVFLEMPSKDVSLFAERQRETFYSHARLFALETLRFKRTVLRDVREYIVGLILQILTHRSQTGDRELILFAQAWPSSTNGSDWAIMLLWAEVKMKIASGGSKIETTLNDRISRLLSWKGRRQRRANGLIGYLLVAWMNTAEASQDNRLTIEIAKFARDWVETAWSSGSSIECAALCSVLAHFRMLDRSVLISPKYHLLYGHHLSRAGHLEQADEFLTSGVSSSSSPLLFNQLWGYTFELVSVLIRLGRRPEAEKWLAHIEKHNSSTNPDDAMYQNGDDEGSELWKQKRLLGHAEVRVLSDLYQADLLMAAGEVSLVASRLEGTISTVCLMDRNIKRKRRRGDGYVRSLRLALEIRLLEARTWEISPERALNVAKAVVTEFSDTSLLEPHMVQWIIQQLLALCNRLVWTGNVSAASSLLESIVRICRYRHYSDSLKDLLPYAEQRRNTLSSILMADHLGKNPTTLRHESSATTNEQREDPDKPSNKGVSLNENAIFDSTDIIERAPLGTTANDTVRNDPWSHLNMRSSGIETEIKSKAKKTIRKLALVKAPKASSPARSEPMKKAFGRKSASPHEGPEKRPAGKEMIKALAAILRRAPRAPTAEPRKIDPAPDPIEHLVPTEPLAPTDPQTA